MGELIGVALAVLGLVGSLAGVVLALNVGVEAGERTAIAECCAAMECPTDMVPRYVDEQCACVAFLGVE